MSYWHEQVRFGFTFVFCPTEEGRTGFIVQRDYDAGGYGCFFLRWNGGARPDNLFVSWIKREKEPRNWIELWPLEPLRGLTVPAVRALAEERLPQIDDATADHGCLKQPYVIAPSPEQALAVAHPSNLVRASIFKHTPDRFEVRYFAFTDLGGDTDYVRTAVPGTRYCDEQGQSSEWDTLTLADNLEGAHEIARLEMEAIAQAARADTPQENYLQRLPRRM